MSGYMKKPCEHCPFRMDIRPFLTPATDVIYPSVEAMIHAHSTKLQSRFRTYSEYLLSKKEKREHSKSV